MPTRGDAVRLGTPSRLQEPRQAPTPPPTPTGALPAPPRGSRRVEPGVLGDCAECGCTIPSTNTTGVCVKCELAHETLDTRLAQWDAIIAEQRRIQARWGITPAMLRAACRVVELGEED